MITLRVCSGFVDLRFDLTLFARFDVLLVVALCIVCFEGVSSCCV